MGDICNEEKLYIGCKIIKAKRMDEITFLTKIKQQPTERNQETRPGYKVEYPDGYISWSPKETFELAYREITKKEKLFMLPVVEEFSAMTPPSGTT